MAHSTDAVAGLDGARSIVVVRGSSTKIERTGKKNRKIKLKACQCAVELRIIWVALQLKPRVLEGWNLDDDGDTLLHRDADSFAALNNCIYSFSNGIS